MIGFVLSISIARSVYQEPAVKASQRSACLVKYSAGSGIGATFRGGLLQMMLPVPTIQRVARCGMNMLYLHRLMFPGRNKIRGVE